MQKIILVLVSGVLLFLAFPPFGYEFLAWVALVPLIYVCLDSGPGESFRYGLAAGLVFWLSGIFWLSKVTYLGWCLGSLYCALYMALFALIASWWFRNLKTFNVQRSTSNMERMDLFSKLKVRRWMLKVSDVYRVDLLFLFGLPAIWVGLECARANFITGFPWNLLGVSQYKNVSLIQCAEWGGVYLVSYLIVLGNTAIALLYGKFETGAEPSPGGRRPPRSFLYALGWAGRSAHGSCRRPNFLDLLRPVVAFFLVIAVALAVGKCRQNALPEITQSMNVAGIQLNVPQEDKWSSAAVNDIYYRLKQATLRAGSAGRVDLVVWPETSLPDFVRYSGPSSAIVAESVRKGVPLLAGSMDYEEFSGRTNYFNSSLLYLPGVETPQVYAKRHLVPFGEYVPLGKYLPFLRSIADAEDGEDFTPGTETVVFRLDEKGRKFGVLICFEDILPYLARDCVRAGARLLINQTNDAWFDPYWACHQQMAHCVFRCVENRVACLRVTNTGLTCLIDRSGRICSELDRLGDAWRAPEILRAKADFSPENMPLTFYTRHGDLFAMACFAFTLPILAGALLSLIWKRK